MPTQLVTHVVPRSPRATVHRSAITSPTEKAGSPRQDKHCDKQRTGAQAIHRDQRTLLRSVSMRPADPLPLLGSPWVSSGALTEDGGADDEAADAPAGVGLERAEMEAPTSPSRSERSRAAASVAAPVYSSVQAPPRSGEVAGSGVGLRASSSTTLPCSRRAASCASALR
eukprot:scaffold7900_cov363-Prasinococcus_capsulatus_cf.AAC.2